MAQQLRCRRLLRGDGLCQLREIEPQGHGVQVGPQAGVPQSLDGSVKYVIGAPAESMKDFGARVLLPKLLTKARAEIKELKAEVAALKASK